MTRKVCECYYLYNADGTVTIRLVNCITGAETTRKYKSLSAAKAADTKFTKSMTRLYSFKAN